MNAGLEESISGIEVVKATVQEAFERYLGWEVYNHDKLEERN